MKWIYSFGCIILGKVGHPLNYLGIMGVKLNTIKAQKYSFLF